MDQITSIFGKSLETVIGNCSEHGEYKNVRVVGTDIIQCPHCTQIKMSREEIEKAQKKRLQVLFECCDIPERFRNAGFKNFIAQTNEQKHAVELCQAYIRSFSISWKPVHFVGTFGTGKTHLACACGNNLISKGVSVKYTTMHSMLSDIKKAYSTDGLSEVGQIAKYVDGFDVLILDEVDVTRGTDNDMSLIFAVVNGRYNAVKPIITISNQPIKKLVEFLGARTIDRLNENSVVVACEWESYRSK